MSLINDSLGKKMCQRYNHRFYILIFLFFFIFINLQTNEIDKVTTHNDFQNLINVKNRERFPISIIISGNNLGLTGIGQEG